VKSIVKNDKKYQKNKSVYQLRKSIKFISKPFENNYFGEIAKMRAVRMVWSKLLIQFKPKNQGLFALHINATIETSFDAFQAILGGCQRVILKDKKHLFFEEETGILKTIDPWEGSTYVEKRTEEIITKSCFIFKESII